MTLAYDALTRQIEVTCRFEAELEVMRQRLALAEKVIEVLRAENLDLEMTVAERDREIERLNAMIDGACT